MFFYLADKLLYLSTDVTLWTLEKTFNLVWYLAFAKNEINEKKLLLEMNNDIKKIAEKLNELKENN